MGGYFDGAQYALDVFKGQLGDPDMEGMMDDFQDLLRELDNAKSGDSSPDDYLAKLVDFKKKWLRRR